MSFMGSVTPQRMFILPLYSYKLFMMMALYQSVYSLLKSEYPQLRNNLFPVIEALILTCLTDTVIKQFS